MKWTSSAWPAPSLRRIPGIGDGVQACLSLASLEGVEDGDIAALPGAPAGAVRKRRIDWLAGRLCAHAALGALGAEAPEPLGRHPSGAPAWPAGWTGSITHAAGVAMAVAAPARPGLGIGIDTEAVIANRSTAAAVIAQCIHPHEQERFDPGRHPALLTLLFSAKEAYYKAARAGVGRMIDFLEMAVVEIDRAQARLRLAPAAGADPDLPGATGDFTWAGRRVITRVLVEAVPPPAAGPRRASSTATPAPHPRSARR
jgi:enterobactin synthetase component D